MYSVFMQEAYDVNLAIHNYGEVIETGKLDERLVSSPTMNFINQLSEEQILACIAWHFRRDHFSEGSLIADSIGNGENISKGSVRTGPLIICFSRFVLLFLSPHDPIFLGYLEVSRI